MNPEMQPSRPIKVIVEKHADGYIAYPLGMRGVVVAQGDSFDEVVREVHSAIKAHIETFGSEAIDGSEPLEAFVAETVL